MAMSSNVARYFDFDDSNCIHTESSTILTEVRSKRKTRGFPGDCLFHKIVFSPHDSYMYLYEQKKQRKFHFGYDFSPEELGLTAASFVQETVLFLSRGHSVRDALCTCNPHLSHKRYLDYGLGMARANRSVILDTSVTHSRPAACPLDVQSEKCFTAEQVCVELGIVCLRSTFLQVPSRRSVYDILQQSGEFVIHSDANGAAETWELCDKYTVSDKASLLLFLQKRRMGAATNDKKLQYDLLSSDVQSLVHSGDIMHLRKEGMLYAVSKSHQQRKCDDDLIQLWKKCK